MQASALFYDILSLLADDDESPWILHHSLMRDFDYGDLDIRELLATLDEVERRGWAVPWALIDDDADPNRSGPPSAEYKAEALTAYDDLVRQGQHGRLMLEEYGPWYAITPEGRAEFERLDRQAEQDVGRARHM